jgi:curli biogenesis system outer membrane secretion channel CsgG
MQWGVGGHRQGSFRSKESQMPYIRNFRGLISGLAIVLFCSAAYAQAPATPPAAAAVAPDPNAPKITIMSFEYGTVRTYVQQIFGGDQDIGKGISDLLVDKLLKDGKYRLIERSALDKILAEQNFSNSDRADSTTAAKIGKVLGVDAIVIGSITQFGRDDQHTNVGGGGYGLGKFGLGGVGTSKAKAVVGITARIINVSTGEILASATGKGESTRSSTALLGGGGGWSGGGGGGLDMGSSNFANTILGEAVHKAVDDTGTQLDDAAGKIPKLKLMVNGLVADVSGNTLILNVGKKAGVHVGDVLVVSRQVRTVKDPATGKVIKSVEDKVGSATVTDADDDSCTATYAGSGPAKVGDVVKNN